MDIRTASPPNQPINTLTVSELEHLITEIVRRVLQEEMQKKRPSGTTQPSENFLRTFGSWEDPRPVQTIVAEIYDSRTSSSNEIGL